MATLAAGLATHGPGRLSADAAFGRARNGIGWGLGAIGLGIGAATAALRSRHLKERHNTEAEVKNHAERERSQTAR